MATWRAQLDTAVNDQQAAAALEDGSVSLTLNEVHLSASWVCRQIREAIRPNNAEVTGSPTLVLKIDYVEESSGGSVNTVVALFLEKSSASVLGALGSLMASVLFIDVPATSSESEITRIIRVSQPTVIITTSSLRPRLPEALVADSVRRVILMDDLPRPAELELYSVVALLPGEDDNASASSDDADGCQASETDCCAFCVLTSGTTSLSKVVVCGHQALMCASGYFSDDIGAGDRVGLFWVYYYMLSALCLGATVFMLPDKTFFDPRALIASVHENRLTALYVTPSILGACVQSCSPAQLETELASLRVVWLTGEQVTPKLREQVAQLLPWVRIRNIYSTNESGDVAVADSDNCFKSLDGVHIEVLDPESLQPVPEGEVGALHVNGSSFQGYWTESKAFSTRAPDERFRSGDLVRKLAGGAIEFVSREAGSHIKVRGFKVFPELVEAELVKHPQVESVWCAAVGDDGDDTSNRLEAAVKLTPGAALSSGKLRDFIAARVPPYMVPVAFRDLSMTSGGELTVATSGKRPDPKSIADLVSGLPHLTENKEMLLPNQEVVATMWAHVLELPVSTFGASANFFDYGGSLAFFRLAKEISADLDVDIPVSALLDVPELDAMALFIFSAATVAPSGIFDVESELRKYPLVPFKATGSLSPSAATLAAQATLARSQVQPMKAVLVTGGTGYVGAFLIESLACRSDVSEVVALIRASDNEAAGKRLNKTLARRAIESTAWLSKVTPLAGDVKEEQFGLSEEAFAFLACRIHSVVHAAAEVNMLKPATALTATNVGGVAHVLSFALLANAPILLTSTMKPLDGATPSGYRQSKEIAEALCLEARFKFGIPSSVLQLGDIGLALSSATATYSSPSLPDDDYLVIMLRTCIALSMIPYGVQWSVSIMAVNHCADMISCLVLDSTDADFTAEPSEVKGDLVQWDTLVQWLMPALPMLRACTLEEWKLELERVADLDDNSGIHYSERAITSSKQMAMLVVSMEQEFSAEDKRRVNGEGIHGKLVVDKDWGQVFAMALAAEDRD